MTTAADRGVAREMLRGRGVLLACVVAPGAVSGERVVRLALAGGGTASVAVPVGRVRRTPETRFGAGVPGPGEEAGGLVEAAVAAVEGGRARAELPDRDLTVVDVPLAAVAYVADGRRGDRYAPPPPPRAGGGAPAPGGGPAGYLVEVPAVADPRLRPSVFRLSVEDGDKVRHFSIEVPGGASRFAFDWPGGLPRPGGDGAGVEASVEFVDADGVRVATLPARLIEAGKGGARVPM